jgi:aminodeoxyfutalosine deaminase
MHDDTETARLLRAAWLVPVATPPVPDGAVIVESGRIAAMGHYQDMVRLSPAGTATVDYGDAALLPALVNAHTHLELTGLAGRIPLPQPGFPAWLQHLMPLRATLDQEKLLQGVLDGRRLLRENGVAVCGDVSNRAQAALPAADRFPLRRLFLEVLGFDVNDLEAALEGLGCHHAQHVGGLPPDASLAAHACYSTSAALIQAAKDWDRQRRAPFSIHVAEHPEEMQFLRDGSGFCREFLERLGRWVPSWKAPAMTPVAFLERLGVLDDHTLLVHAVHLTEGDWQVVARRRCSVCFCPRSNDFLAVGRPAIDTAVRLGVPAALGTDSLTSNRDLNLFAEALAVLEHYPGVSPEAVLHMATLGGARALLEHADHGSITAGKAGELLAVRLPTHLRPEDLIATVIQQGSQGAWQWASHSHPV